jgi:hypothetical protein
MEEVISTGFRNTIMDIVTQKQTKPTLSFLIETMEEQNLEACFTLR